MGCAQINPTARTTNSNKDTNGDNNSADDDDFDYQELLRHIEPEVLSSMETQRGLPNMDI
jgi:hypothetical protein